jgi:hypothetical protein
MIVVSKQIHSAVWALITLTIGAGWVLFGLLGNGNTVILAIMIVLSMVLTGGAAILLKRG